MKQSPNRKRIKKSKGNNDSTNLIKKKKENFLVCPNNQLPSHIQRIYLDGNNMMFFECKLRNLFENHKRKEADQVLADIAFKYAELLEKVEFILVYDRTTLNITKKITSESKTSDFLVLSAFPDYQSTDDALVDWAEKLGESVKNTLFVTSDKKLQDRLYRIEASSIMKPQRWMKMVRSAISKEQYNSLLPS